MDFSPRKALAAITGLLVLASLACQTGQVLTPEEGTARAREMRSVQVRSTPTPPEAGQETAEQGVAGLRLGDTVTLVGTGFMISLMGEPGASRIIAQQERGAQAQIQDVEEINGVLWYLVRAPTGLGWVMASNVQPVIAAEPTAEPAAEEAAPAEGPQPGDTAYLIGRSFLISFYQEPGATRIIAQQERGAAVVIEEVDQADAETWYLVRAPTGLGWVKGENISLERP